MKCINKHKIKNIFVILILFVFLFSCSKDYKNILYVYNQGLFLDLDVINLFEKKYNVKVVYDTFDTNEEMYAIVKENGRVYDVICATDYMIQKMKLENLLYHYDINEKLKNANNLYSNQNIAKLTSSNKKIFGVIPEEIDNSFEIKNTMDMQINFSNDKNNTYAVPYVYSTIGLIYNKTILDKKKLSYPKKWDDLWNEQYKGEILMQDALRDVLMVGLKKNNFSMNTKNDFEIEKAKNDLIKQKHLVNAYMIDELRDKMVMGDGSISVMYSGDVQYIMDEGRSLGYEYEYILPEEGVNMTIDAWIIPNNSKNKNLALLWIDFLLDAEIAKKNFDFLHYGLPNVYAISEMLKIDGYEEILKKQHITPKLKNIDYEVYEYLGDYEELYNEAYKQIKSYEIDN